MSLGTYLYTWLYGNLVGHDEFDNKYYCNSKDFQNINSKRWIIFNGEICLVHYLILNFFTKIYQKLSCFKAGIL